MTVDDQGLHIKSGRNDKLIPFRNITTVSKFDLASPWAWAIKYVNPSKNTHHKISYIPKAEYQQGFKDDEMTAYIIDQARANNPNYQQTSTVKNLLILFIAGLPVGIAMIYFMTQT